MTCPGRRCATQASVPMVEIIMLGPLGPFMCQLALDSVTTASQLPMFLQALLAVRPPSEALARNTLHTRPTPPQRSTRISSSTPPTSHPPTSQTQPGVVNSPPRHPPPPPPSAVPLRPKHTASRRRWRLWQRTYWVNARAFVGWAVWQLRNPVKMPGFALRAARRFWGNMRLRRKLLAAYGVLHQLNAPVRRKERVARAAGIMAMRRLSGDGACPPHDEWSGREAAGGVPESAREPSPVYPAGRVGTL
jgi:hypothetical protein